MALDGIHSDPSGRRGGQNCSQAWDCGAHNASAWSHRMRVIRCLRMRHPDDLQIGKDSSP